jgi:chromosomal replication initiator protein
MVSNIDSPDLQTRIALVREFVARLSAEWPEDVLQFIAMEIASGTRELSGAVNRLHAESRIHGCEINLDFAAEKLNESLRHHAKTIRLADVERAVCNVFGLAKESLQSTRRSKHTNAARMLAMWLARKYTRAGLAEIGQYFGRRSHSTVISAHRRVSGWVADGTQVELTDSHCRFDEALRRVESQIRAG